MPSFLHEVLALLRLAGRYSEQVERSCCCDKQTSHAVIEGQQGIIPTSSWKMVRQKSQECSNSHDSGVMTSFIQDSCNLASSSQSWDLETSMAASR